MKHNKEKNMELEKQLMIQAYNGTSFSPEKRGESDFKEFTEMLRNDLKALGENQGNYREKFIAKLNDYYHKRSRCFSSMIAGPANFPVRQQQKRHNSADKALDHFFHWRGKYFKAVNRERTLSPEEEIDKTLAEIDKLVLLRDFMKEANKIIRKGKLTAVQVESLENEKQIKAHEELVELFKSRYSEEKSQTMAAELLKPDFLNIIGFASYQITSTSTKIRERKKKLQVMRNRIEAKQNQKPVNFEGGSIYIENDRVIISHDEKPEREIIKAIKSNGFRWSPKMNNWCRKHTGNAVADANYLLTNFFGGEIKECR